MVEVLRNDDSDRKPPERSHTTGQRDAEWERDNDGGDDGYPSDGSPREPMRCRCEERDDPGTSTATRDPMGA